MTLRSAPARLPLPLLAGALVACAGLLPAQTSIRGFGRLGYDSTILSGRDHVQLALGHQYAAVLRADGSIVLWGLDTSPDLALPAGAQIAKVAGAGLPLVLLTDGRLFQLGRSTMQLPGGPYVDVFGGLAGLAKRSDQTLMFFGSTANGQHLVPPPPAGLVYDAGAVGGSHCLGLLSDGSVVAWGGNTLGQCNVPTLPPGTTYTSVAAGLTFSLVLRSDGAALAFGDNTAGQCNVPPLPTGLRYTAIAGGGHHALLLRSDGALLAIGDNAFGQCNVPALPAPVRDLSAGYGTGAALLTNGQVVVWGHQVLANPPDLPPGVHYVAVACGLDCGLGLRSDGLIEGWGDNSAGQISVPPLPPGVRYVDVRTVGDRPVPAQPVSWSCSLALRSDGAIVAFGSDLFSLHAVPPLPPGLRYIAMDHSVASAIALRSDGSVVQWGIGLVAAAAPPPLPAGVLYTAVVAAYRNHAALRSDGNCVVWGDNWYGLNLVPTLPAGVRYAQVEIALSQAFARCSDGSIRAWGFSIFGFNLPAMTPGTSIVELACDYGMGAARRSDGQIVGMGFGMPPLPPLPAHLAYSRLSACSSNLAAIVGPASSYMQSGTGCAGSMPTPRLVPLDTPRIGETFAVGLVNLPLDAAFVVTGFSESSASFGPLPFPLATVGFGAACMARCSIDLVQSVVGRAGHATSELVVPRVTSLIGTTFFQQAFVIDSAAGTALPGVVSDAAVARVGGS